MQIFFRIALLAGIFLMFPEVMNAQKDWKSVSTVEDVCESYPEVMRTMLNHYNLDHPGLEKAKSAYAGGKLTDACRFLLDYYRDGNTARHLRKEQPVPSGKTDANADTTLNNVFFIQNVRGQLPYLPDGHRDWHYKGPNNDEEWAWLSNRHGQISHVLSVYFDTGNPKYAEYIDLFLKDFIIKSMPYPAVSSRTSVWRGLEVAARAKVWSRIFFGMINSDLLSPATKLLMLSSLPDHAHYNRNFHAGNNWLTMEISALATIATNFPEFKMSDAWLDYSINAMVESMKDQVYPDGVQTELTSHYHNVSMFNFELFQDICVNAGKTLPDFFNRTIEDMYGYIARAMRPDGSRILNNDGDRGMDRNIILRGAEKYDNKEWEFIATHGKSGVKPADGPSWFFPWAGQLISRSGYDPKAHWSFFDVGPWGSGHQHNDKLNISISAYGRDLLVDAGRFAYTGEVARKFRRYACGSAGHNVLLVDGKGQAPGPTHAKEPVPEGQYKITGTFDYASGSFDRFLDTKGDVKHTRSVMYVRGEYWVVVDRITTDRPRTIDALWHWHPECSVVQEKDIVRTSNKKGNLAVIPAGNHSWSVSLVKGQEQPELQGWYSPEYNVYEPNAASIFSTGIKGNATMVWLLVPSEKKMPKLIPEIISEDESGVTLRVKSNKKSREMHIPFENSSNARLTVQ